MSPVPTVTQVTPGASVNIVLKKDQPTGRQVTGTVKDLLTRGDHHRGIKVRLTDGRIGRVQSLASGTSASSLPDQSWFQAGAEGSGVEEGISSVVSGDTGGRGFGRRHGRHRDVRLDERLERPPEQIGLDAYIKPAKQRGKGKKTGSSQNQRPSEDDPVTHSPEPTDIGSAAASCPVCEAFTGDEAAVAHHVASHFE